MWMVNERRQRLPNVVPKLKEKLNSFSLVFLLLVTLRTHFPGYKLYQFKSSVVEVLLIEGGQSFQY